MVFTLNFSHLFHYPIDLVMKTYSTKHKLSNEVDTIKVEEVSSFQEGEMQVRQMKLTLRNFFPPFFRRIAALKTDYVTMEEEVWSQTETERHWIRSRNQSWEEVTIARLAFLSKSVENPNWTLWEQDTSVDLSGFGVFSRVLEIYLKRHLRESMIKEIQVMERLMKNNEQGT